MQSINVCVVRSMDRFCMDPVPDEHTFIQTVRHVIFDDYFMGLQHKHTTFYQIISECVEAMYDQVQEEYKAKRDSNIDIMFVYQKLCTLNNIGAGLTNTQIFTLSDLTTYMRQYMRSQKIDSKNKDIPTEYIEQNEDDFIKDTLDFLATLYNMTIEDKKFRKSIRGCVEIFWEYNVTWKRIQRDVTLDDIRQLSTYMENIKTEMGFEHSPIGKKFDSLTRYLTNWFYFKDRLPKKPTPDINARVEQLEHEIQELQAQVQALTNEFSSAHVPTLERQSLLQKLARLT